MSTYAMKPADREYVLGRLDRKHIEELGKEIRHALYLGHAVEACYQPGDATWYALVFARPFLHGSEGGGTAGSGPSSYIGNGRTFISYLQRGTISDFGALDDPEWVAGKLTDNNASALAIAELIKEVQQ